jgi:hypothetical protein
MGPAVWKCTENEQIPAHALFVVDIRDVFLLFEAVFEAYAWQRLARRTASVSPLAAVHAPTPYIDT